MYTQGEQSVHKIYEKYVEIIVLKWKLKKYYAHYKHLTLTTLTMLIIF